MTKEEDNLILEQYIQLALAQFKHRSDNSVECIYCGTSELKGKIWLSNKGRLVYNCWRETCPAHKAILAKKWLKKANSELYSEYVKAIKNQDNSEMLAKLKENAKKYKLEREKIEERLNLAKKDKDNESIKYFYRITKNTDLSEKAKKYCISRHIPEKIYSHFFVAEYGKYYDRVIIPFYHKDGKIGCFQGRALDGNKIKYLTRIGHTELYNYDFLDRMKPVMVLEGPINSMFVENGTATCGVGSSEDLNKQLENLDCRYITDNDEAGFTKARELVKSGKYVFIWKKYKIEHNLPNYIDDINDLYLYENREKPYTYTELTPYFTKNYEEYHLFDI